MCFAKTVTLKRTLSAPRFKPPKMQFCGNTSWRSKWLVALAANTLLLILCTNSSGEDWPHPRGPGFDGVFTNASIALPWPTNGLPLLWERPIGQGFSGLAVQAGRIFTQAQSLGGQEVISLSLETGEVLWRTRHAIPWEVDGLYPGPYGTPAVDSGRVFVGDCYGTIQCFDAQKGTRLWTFDAVRKLNPAGVDFGYAATPLVLDGQVFAPSPAGDSKTTAFSLEAATGRLLWSSGTNFPSYASFLPIQVQGQRQLVLLLRNGISAFDPKTGAELWHDEWTHGYDEHATWPVYREPFLLCSSAFKRGSRLYRLSIEAGRPRAELIWQEKVLSNDVFSSVLVDGFVYGFDLLSSQAEYHGRTRGSLKCLEFMTGQVRWTNQEMAHCSVSIVGKHLLLLDDAGRLAVANPDPAGYRELASMSLPARGKYWTAPVVVGNRLLVRSRDTVACYGLGGSETAVAASGPAPAPGLSLMDWMQKHRSPAFTAPTLQVLTEWYAGSLVVMGLAMMVGRKHLAAGLVAAFVLGLAGTFGLTMVCGRFVFTVPVSLCAAFCLLLLGGLKTTGRPWHGWVFLLAFIGLCLGYYSFCTRYYLLAGWGFLTGFPFALPPGILLVKRCRDPAGWLGIILGWATISAFYWGASIVILKRTG